MQRSRLDFVEQRPARPSAMLERVTGGQRRRRERLLRAELETFGFQTRFPLATECAAPLKITCECDYITVKQFVLRMFRGVELEDLRDCSCSHVRLVDGDFWLAACVDKRP